MKMKKESQNLAELESMCGHHFQDIAWLEMAMRHSSYTNEHHMNRLDCNERLEFLGDAVLELVSSEFLYQNYPELPEGELSKLRASLVCEPTLAYDAKALNLGAHLLLGRGEELTGGRLRDSTVSDALEATIGAIFMDGGFDEAKKFVLRFVLDDVEHKQMFRDSKSRLQEIVQGETKQDVEYVLIGETGPDHAKTFTSEVRIGGKTAGTGSGHSKKSAEQQAAYHAIIAWKGKK